MRRFLLVCLLAAHVGTACGRNETTGPTVNVPFSSTDLRVGTGAAAVAGGQVTVNYTGWFYSTTAVDNKGSVFDSSFNPGRTPLSIILSTSSVITGWVQGVPGMRVGGLRRLVLPPALAYGSTGSSNGQIPPNATLIFEIELLSVP